LSWQLALHVPAMVSLILVPGGINWPTLVGWVVCKLGCFINRLPECAALAKANLNGAQFGNQCINVEYKNIPAQRSASGTTLLSSPPPTTALLHTPPITGTSSSRGLNNPALAAAGLWSLIELKQPLSPCR